MPVIGVALSIPEPWATELQDYRTGLDPSAALVPTHITLVPPTEIDDDAVDRRRGAPGQGGRGRLPRSRCTCGGPARSGRSRRWCSSAWCEGISQTEQLAAAVRSGPLDVDVEFPFHPHVTVAHHLTDEQMDQAFDDLAEFECSFDVTSFHLYVHDDAEGWRPTRDFALQRGPGDD